MYDNQAKTLEEIKNAKEMYIHEGAFHMDEMLCVSLVKRVNPNIKIIRERTHIPEDTTAIICDCRGGYFDHHFDNPEDIKQRENGQKMASIGCLMQVMGQEIFGDKWKEIDEKIISRFDAADLQIKDEFLSKVILHTNPRYKQNETIEGQIRMSQDVCNYIIDSLKNYENQSEKNIEDLTFDFFSKRNMKGDISKRLSYAFGENSLFQKEIENPDSTFNIILNGLENDKALAFFEKIYGIESTYEAIQEMIKEEVKTKALKSENSNQNYILFEEYPGPVANLCRDTPINFVITNQQGKYCINIVDKENPEETIKFPKNLTGQDNDFREETNYRIPKAIRVLQGRNSPQEKGEIISGLLNRTFKIESIEDEIETYEKLIDLKKDLSHRLEIFNERKIEFIHPNCCFAKFREKEDAIAFIDYITKEHIDTFAKNGIEQNDLNKLISTNMNLTLIKNETKAEILNKSIENKDKGNYDIFINMFVQEENKKLSDFLYFNDKKLESINDYNTYNNLIKELGFEKTEAEKYKIIDYISTKSKIDSLGKEIEISKDYADTIIKAAKEGMNIDKIMILGETINNDFENTKAVYKCMKAGMNEQMIKKYSQTLDEDSLEILRKDIEQGASKTLIKSEAKVLEIFDAYHGQDLNNPEIRKSMKNELVDIVKEIDYDYMKSQSKSIEEIAKQKNIEIEGLNI